MPLWTPEPPEDQRAVAFSLVRVSADKILKGIVTCVDPVGTNTHFATNRTIPCEGDADCKLCAQGFTWRWHCYVSVLETATTDHVILELTAAGSQALRNYANLHAGVRGCGLEAWRPSKRTNGRVVTRCVRLDQRTVRIPEPPDIPRILCHIWNVQYENPIKTFASRLGAGTFAVPPPGDDGRN